MCCFENKMASKRGSKNGGEQIWEMVIILLLLVFIGMQAYKLIQASQKPSPTMAPSMGPTMMPTMMPTMGKGDDDSDDDDSEMYAPVDLVEKVAAASKK